MRITVRSVGAEQRMEMADGSTPEDVLREMKLHPDAHLVVRNNTPIPLDEKLADGDSIRVIKVASGG